MKSERLDMLNPLDFLECDFFSIEEDEQSGKCVHVLGYPYRAECGEGDPEYRFVEFCWLRLPISLFPGNYRKELERLECECKQYVGEYGEEGIREMIAGYFDDPHALSFDDITPDTPCGNYVDA